MIKCAEKPKPTTLPSGGTSGTRAPKPTSKSSSGTPMTESADYLRPTSVPSSGTRHTGAVIKKK